MKKLALLLAGVLFAGPVTVLVAPALIANPAVLQAAACSVSSLTVVAEVPDELVATTRDGVQVVLNKTQLTHARTVIQIGASIDEVGREGVIIALMAGLTESRMRMLANTVYPESADYPNDGVGADHDSLGIFQMRPQAGWGTVAELMSVTYQAQAFYGGPNGPNYPSPRGLLDIPNWQQLTRGEVAQAVEVSAFPDRYANWEPVAEAILTALTVPSSGGGGDAPASGDIAPTTRIVVPMPEGSYVKTSPFGMREDPLQPGLFRMHYGTDFAAPDGTPILSMADGVVLWAGNRPGWNNILVIEHNISGAKVVTLYAHMWDHGYHVRTGDRVSAGQHVADVGTEGYSTGPHLHFEVHPGGWESPAVDPDVWLSEHGAEGVTDPSTSVRSCTR
ncbi:M23 family metallopeptidase [Gulosibacter chungangensis]|uniref:M23 family metallopeptidase n=1 Tax=Gulosibacter chungangensis TaxID=979746 RepID=A0A7J5B9N5_9MICO|nr:M23 family metallopeptidase [Gulosibacter chungangensis]KAB1641394.1 M23 family metallopeptidase [Gulosibacter chungangensis]